MTIPNSIQPQQADFDFDLSARLDSVVSIKAQIPNDAFTAEILGTERQGHGAVISATGLIATIGYLITEAESVWIQAANGQVIAGDVIGYDYESGYGLVQPLGRLNLQPFELGSSDQLSVGSATIVAGYGGVEQAISAEVVSKNEFVGYWEYLLEEAIYTTPAHPNWGGAALIGEDGKLYGIGSLYTQEIEQTVPGTDGNMIVPINLLKNILDELLKYGQTTKPPRPWLGMFTTESADGLVIAGVYDDAPAFHADLRAGDQIVSLAGDQVSVLSDFFRQIWSLGPAGTVVPLTVKRDETTFDVNIESTDRRSHWKAPNLH